jgi:hypothetical protein
MKMADAPEGTPWRGTLLFEYYDDRDQALRLREKRRRFARVGGGNDELDALRR